MVGFVANKSNNEIAMAPGNDKKTLLQEGVLYIGKTWRYYKLSMIEVVSQLFDWISFNRFQLSNQAKLNSFRKSFVRLAAPESVHVLAPPHSVYVENWLNPAFEAIRNSCLILKKMKNESIVDPLQMTESLNLEKSFHRQRKNLMKYYRLVKDDFTLANGDSDCNKDFWKVNNHLRELCRTIVKRYGEEIANAEFINPAMQSFFDLTNKQLLKIPTREFAVRGKTIIDEVIISLENAPVIVPSTIQVKILSVREQLIKLENQQKKFSDNNAYWPAVIKKRALAQIREQSKKAAKTQTSSSYREAKIKLENEFKVSSPNLSEGSRIRYELIIKLDIIIRALKGYSRGSATFWKSEEEKKLIEFVKRSIYIVDDYLDVINTSKMSNRDLLFFAQKVYADLVANRETFPVKAREQAGIGYALNGIEAHINELESHIANLTEVKSMRKDIINQIRQNKLRLKLQRAINQVNHSDVLMENINYRSKIERLKTLLNIPFQPKKNTLHQLLATDLKKLDYKQLSNYQPLLEREMSAIYLEVFS